LAKKRLDSHYTGHILIVEDDEDMSFMLNEAIMGMGHITSLADSIKTANYQLDKINFDAVLLDYRLPDGIGWDLIPVIKKKSKSTIIIGMTAYGNTSLAGEALDAGAYDYFNKPFLLKELKVVLNRGLERKRLQNEVLCLKEDLKKNIPSKGPKLIGNCEAIKNTLKMIERVKKIDVNLLLRGETGTGKDIIAQTIYYNSNRNKGPFVKVNCAAIPDNLLESELFGYAKGAFTGALKDHAGKFEIADKGILFLDEIGELSLQNQAKLLRVLQDFTIERIGESKSRKTDVRIITATNRNLEQMVSDNTFREDLYFRLNIMTINLPPLRERLEDIETLVEFFIKKFNKSLKLKFKCASEKLIGKFKKYKWPGNIRELEHVIMRAMVINEMPVLESAEFGNICFSLNKTQYLRKNKPLPLYLEEIEKNAIEDTLGECHGIQSRAAVKLGITQRSLWHRVKKLKINIEEFIP
jgi:two-component system, NtrC family, response regulator AtoC